MSDLMKSMHQLWLPAAGLLLSLAACGGAVEFDEEAGDELEMETEESPELGQAEQAWWSYGGSSHGGSSWWSSLSSSCYDPTGTDSVLAGLAVATAQELRRWQPTLDFQISNNMLALSATGKGRCADGRCMNTQALLDMQKAPSSIQVRPGVRVSPTTLKYRLTHNYKAQKRCTSSLFSGCRAPDHEFRFLHSEPGACDQYFWFEVRTPSGGLLGSRLKELEDKLVWVDAEDNSYIKFQTDGGSAIAIDPTYGLNATTSTSAGVCSSACLKVSATNIAGTCCSCSGKKKKYSRSAWSAATYVCQ